MTLLALAAISALPARANCRGGGGPGVTKTGCGVATSEMRVAPAWSYSAVAYLAIVVLTSLILAAATTESRFSKAA